MIFKIFRTKNLITDCFFQKEQGRALWKDPGPGTGLVRIIQPFGPREKITSNTTGPEDVNGSAFYHEKTAGWSFGAPTLADYLGDRVRQVEIVDGGFLMMAE